MPIKLKRLRGWKGCVTRTHETKTNLKDPNEKKVVGEIYNETNIDRRWKLTVHEETRAGTEG